MSSSWVESSEAPVLYLTGLSGSGKSSLLAAWVLPNLERGNTHVARLRGYQDSPAAIEQELRTPGVVWKKPASEVADPRLLLEQACRYFKPGASWWCSLAKNILVLYSLSDRGLFDPLDNLKSAIPVL
jgi:hypothetical protein